MVGRGAGDRRRRAHRECRPGWMAADDRDLWVAGIAHWRRERDRIAVHADRIQEHVRWTTQRWSSRVLHGDARGAVVRRSAAADQRRCRREGDVRVAERIVEQRCVVRELERVAVSRRTRGRIVEPRERRMDHRCSTGRGTLDGDIRRTRDLRPHVERVVGLRGKLAPGSLLGPVHHFLGGGDDIDPGLEDELVVGIRIDDDAVHALVEIPLDLVPFLVGPRVSL